MAQLVPWRHLLKCHFHSCRSLLYPRKTRFASPIRQSQIISQLDFQSIDLRSNGLKFPDSVSPPSEIQKETSDIVERKSRNEKKREARRAVRWGMDLATFSPVQIKRILRAVSLDKEVFEAIMLVKRFGRDVREGKRRQFNYIGRLLRDVEPEMMDALIQASKDGDDRKILNLTGQKILEFDKKDDEKEVESYNVEDDDPEKDCHNDGEIAIRWFDGLIGKDTSITKEVYAIHNVEFDRQELRNLVRRVHSIQKMQDIEEIGDQVDNPTMSRAKNSLVRFLRTIAKKMLAERI